SGHLASWDLGTGAIDDGAGVAVSMEVANVIQKLHLKPKRTIRVIAWMNEENGLGGSKQYAKDHEKDWANHFAVMETDGGADHPVGLHIKAKPEVKAMLKPIGAVLQESGAGALELAEHAGADIEPMEKAGVPAFAPIRQNTRSMRAVVVDSLAHCLVDLLGPHSQHPELLRAFSAVIEDWHGAGEDARARSLPFLFATFKLFENAWFQQRQGTLDSQ